MNAFFERAHDALAFLEHHRLEPTASRYALALAYTSEPESMVARDIAALIDGGLRLTAEQADALATRHSVQGAEAPAARREQAMVKHSEELGTLTEEAYGIARSLGDDAGIVARRAEHIFPDGDDVTARLMRAERALAELRDDFVKLRDAVRADFQAHHDFDRDALTQALNQVGARHIMERLAQHDRGYVVLMFAIDSLAAINHKFGTSVGDNLLNAFAAKLRRVFVDQEAIRWSGNEFVVIQPDRTVTAVQILAEEVLLLFANRRFRLRGSGEWIGVVTASAGIVADRGEPFKVLIEKAREKMATAIREGGNRIEV